MDKQQLEHLIERAAAKVEAQKLSDVCRFIPDGNGHIHHFTFWKLVKEDPQAAADLLTKYILQPQTVQRVAPKQRAARGSRKRRDQLTISRQEAEKLLQMARMANDNEMVRRLSPKRDLRSIKRELISSIRHSEVEPELWGCYVELISTQKQLAHQAAEAANLASIIA